MDESLDDRSPYALVVDDEALIRMDAAAILEDAGFRILEAGTGDEALEILRVHHRSIAAVFTDVEMPGQTNGFALARETAKHWPKIGILVASGRHRPGPGDMPEGAEFIAKPFGAEVVIERLKKILPKGQRPAPLEDL